MRESLLVALEQEPAEYKNSVKREEERGREASVGISEPNFLSPALLRSIWNQFSPSFRPAYLASPPALLKVIKLIKLRSPIFQSKPSYHFKPSQANLTKLLGTFELDELRLATTLRARVRSNSSPRRAPRGGHAEIVDCSRGDFSRPDGKPVGQSLAPGAVRNRPLDLPKPG
ncbi:hypothetical protein Trydic_g14280 [Trypoxylus dichotomus]